MYHVNIERTLSVSDALKSLGSEKYEGMGKMGKEMVKGAFDVVKQQNHGFETLCSVSFFIFL